MKLQKVEIGNFKGIEYYSVDFKGENTTIIGDNDTFKTTVVDAVFWVLTGKNSQNEKKFDIKPIDENDKPLPKMDSSVELTYEHEGRIVTLKKTYKEKWESKRGKAEKIFTGHTHCYEIDNVPCNETEFQKVINGICDEEKFKLLANPHYFCTVMKWEKRRELLFDVCGNVTDQEVIESDAELKELPEILDGKPYDKTRKTIKAKKKKMVEEKEDIPIKIKEVKGFIKKTRAKNDVRFDIGELETNLNAIQDKIKVIEAGGNTDVLQKELLQIQNEMSKIENDNQKQEMDLQRKKNNTIMMKTSSLAEAKNTKYQADEKIKGNNFDIRNYEERLEDLRKRWILEDKKTCIITEIEKVCYACKEPIPESKIDSMKQDFVKDFNKVKANNLAEISSKGKEIKKNIKILQDKNRAHKDEIKAVDLKIKNIEAELIETEKQKVDLPFPSEYYDLIKRQEELQTKIDRSKDDNKVPDQLSQEKQLIEGEINKLKSESIDIDNNEMYKNRVKEHSTREKQLGKMIEELERQLFLIEKFIVTKVSMLDDKINTNFQHINFKLFNTLVNGDVEECCEPTVNGVPYRSINGAKKFNAGLEICDVLAKYYGVDVPIIIDNAESVVKLYKTKAQQIKTIVVPGFDPFVVKHGDFDLKKFIQELLKDEKQLKKFMK